jgi:hypothetical protein
MGTLGTCEETVDESRGEVKVWLLIMYLNRSVIRSTPAIAAGSESAEGSQLGNSFLGKLWENV